MKTTLWKKMVSLLAAAFLALLLSFGSAPLPSQQHIAHAATNGQQVSLYCDPTSSPEHKVDRMIISGTNQDGNYVVFDGAPSDAASGWVVWGWWWKGQIYMSWHFANGGGWWYVYTNVPTVSPFDLYSAASC